MSRRRGRAAAAVAGVVLAGVMVWQGTNAAFVAGKRNDGSTVSAGTLVLTDDAASQVFDSAGLVPGSSESQCVRLTYAGSVRSSGVRLWSSVTEVSDAGADGAVLQDHLHVVVEHGSTNTDEAGCGGFQPAGTLYSGPLQELSVRHANYTSGLPLGQGRQPWVPVAGEVRVFRFTVGLAGDAPDAAQGDAVGWRFTWETRNG